MPTSLDDLLSALKAVDVRGMPTAGMEALLRKVSIHDADLAPFVHFEQGRYTRNLVYRDDAFEFLIVCWPANAASPIHDHGHSRCFFKVERGSLTVEDYTLVAGGREAGYANLSQAQAKTLQRGDVDSRSSNQDIHRVRALDGPAISLHVYAAPLDRCLNYDEARQSCHVAMSRYNTIDDSYHAERLAIP